jgi:AraC family transcriptional regulator
VLRSERFETTGALRLEGHGHSAWHLCLVLDGAFEETVGGDRIVCAKGSARLSRPGARHEIAFDHGGGDCLIIEADGPFWNRVLARPIRADASHLFGTVGLQSDVMASLDRDRPLAPRLGELMAAFTFGGADQPTPNWVAESAACLAADPSQSLAQLARRFRVDRGRFAQAFRDRLGYRPAEYRALIRLRDALALVQGSDAPLAEIALACGYAHQSHMNNAFRNILGTTPAASRPRQVA